MIFRLAFPNYLGVGMHYKPHAHAHHEIVLVQQGLFRVRARGKERLAGRGDVMLYTTGTVHEERVEGDAPAITWGCEFEGEGFRHNEPVFRHDVHGHIQELLVKLNNMWMHDSIHGGMHLKYPPVLQALLDELNRLPTWDSHTMVDEVRAFVRSRIAEPLTVDDLASVVGLTKNHFIRQYRILAGRTPMEDVRFLRVETASELIVSTPLPLHEIAPLVGIPNVYHLSKLLKSLLGVGVRDLRHQNKHHIP